MFYFPRQLHIYRCINQHLEQKTYCDGKRGEAGGGAGGGFRPRHRERSGRAKRSFVWWYQRPRMAATRRKTTQSSGKAERKTTCRTEGGGAWWWCWICGRGRFERGGRGSALLASACSLLIGDRMNAIPFPILWVLGCKK